MLSLRQNQIKEMGRMNKFTPAFKAKVAIDAIKEVLYSHTIKKRSFQVCKSTCFIQQNKLICLTK